MIVTQETVMRAMAHWERIHIAKHGPLDGVTLPRECSRLADLLGMMWFAKEDEASIPDGCEVAQLIANADLTSWPA